MSQDNITTLKKVIQSINDRDLDKIERFATPNFTRHDLTGAFLAEGSGSTEATDFLHTLFEAFPDFRTDVQDVFASGDRVAVRYKFSGTHQGILFGIPSTGKKVDFSGINIYRFEENKIAEAWQLWDWAGVLKQIGFLDISTGRRQ